MPVVMCTGSLVSITVYPDYEGSFIVSDDGLGFFEVTSNAHSTKIFDRTARAAAKRYGAAYEASGLFFLKVSADRLRGAMTAMAALVREVVDESIEKSIKEKVHREESEFFARVESVFPRNAVHRDAEFFGSSNTKYRVDALVEGPRGLLLFEMVSKESQSIAAKFTMMSDIYRSESAPELFGVIESREGFGGKLVLINSVASVIEASATEDDIRLLAA